tara:strand:- start:29 stop:328 length:300 start_codon:yes stop_codon:yes gene_type:complete
MANIKKPKSKPIDKGMATLAGAKALELIKRKKAYDKATKATVKARAHVMSVIDSHKKKPDSGKGGISRVGKAVDAYPKAFEAELSAYRKYNSLKRNNKF